MFWLSGNVASYDVLNKQLLSVYLHTHTQIFYLKYFSEQKKILFVKKCETVNFCALELWMFIFHHFSLHPAISYRHRPLCQNIFPILLRALRFICFFSIFFFCGYAGTCWTSVRLPIYMQSDRQMNKQIDYFLKKNGDIYMETQYLSRGHNSEEISAQRHFA